MTNQLEFFFLYTKAVEKLHHNKIHSNWNRFMMLMKFSIQWAVSKGKERRAFLPFEEQPLVQFSSVDLVISEKYIFVLKLSTKTRKNLCEMNDEITSFFFELLEHVQSKYRNCSFFLSFLEEKKSIVIQILGFFLRCAFHNLKRKFIPFFFYTCWELNRNLNRFGAAPFIFLFWLVFA